MSWKNIQEQAPTRKNPTPIPHCQVWISLNDQAYSRQLMWGYEPVEIVDIRHCDKASRDAEVDNLRQYIQHKVGQRMLIASSGCSQRTVEAIDAWQDILSGHAEHMYVMLCSLYRTLTTGQGESLVNRRQWRHLMDTEMAAAPMIFTILSSPEADIIAQKRVASHAEQDAHRSIAFAAVFLSSRASRRNIDLGTDLQILDFFNIPVEEAQQWVNTEFLSCAATSLMDRMILAGASMLVDQKPIFTEVYVTTTQGRQAAARVETSCIELMHDVDPCVCVQTIAAAGSIASVIEYSGTVTDVVVFKDQCQWSDVPIELHQTPAPANNSTPAAASSNWPANAAATKVKFSNSYSTLRKKRRK